MIYLIDGGFRIKSALNILVIQCKYPGIYNECFCLGCNDNVNVNHGTCLASHEQSSFADDLRSSFANNVNDNDNVKDKDNVNNNDNVNVKDSVNDNVNDNDNDNDNDYDNNNFIYLLDEKHGETSMEPVPG